MALPSDRYRITEHSQDASDSSGETVYWGDATRATGPLGQVTMHRDVWRLEMHLPGYARKDVKISVQGDVLTVGVGVRISPKVGRQLRRRPESGGNALPIDKSKLHLLYKTRFLVDASVFRKYMHRVDASNFLAASGGMVRPQPFQRHFQLPPAAEVNEAVVKFRDGNLTILVPLIRTAHPDAEGRAIAAAPSAVTAGDQPRHSVVMSVAPRQVIARERLVREAEAGGELALAELLADASDAPFVERETIRGVGRTIRSLRERQGMTQQALADAAGTTTAQVSLVERGLGARGPGVGLLARLFDALGYEMKFAAPD